MENFKSILFSLVGIAMMAGVGLWAFSTIESGSVHVNTDKQKVLEDQNKDLNKQVTDLKTQMALLESQKENEVASAASSVSVAAPITTGTPTKPVAVKTPNTTGSTTTKPVLKYQSLIDELQKLINSKVTLKKGSQGSSVGSVQKFLNIYNGTSNKIDNDYGVSVVTAVTKFQKDSGISATGQVASATLTKMVAWLKKK